MRHYLRFAFALTTNAILANSTIVKSLILVAGPHLSLPVVPLSTDTARPHFGFKSNHQHEVVVLGAKLDLVHSILFISLVWCNLEIP